jgi:hypothetical protein
VPVKPIAWFPTGAYVSSAKGILLSAIPLQIRRERSGGAYQAASPDRSASTTNVVAPPQSAKPTT